MKEKDIKLSVSENRFKANREVLEDVQVRVCAAVGQDGIEKV